MLRSVRLMSNARLTSTRAFTMSATRSNALPEGYVEDKSKGPMLRYQESLPKLPVPTLEETAAKYLKSVRPVASKQEFEATEKAVREFVAPGGTGQELQKRLEARAADPKVKNWIYEWWNDAAYLTYREPVVPYVSYFYSHKDDPRRKTPAKRAAAIATATLTFKAEVDAGTLEPDYMKKLPICMDSLQYMFNCTRIAAKPADYPKKWDAKDHKYFIAMRNNRFYKVLHEVDGKVLTTAELEQQLQKVIDSADAAGKAPAVGAFTSENRDVWTDYREVLLKNGNEAALTAVEASSFLICLDNSSPVTNEERAHAYWHGDGQNRWYDKPLQFIVNDNATSGFMGEHSMMDGTPTHRLNDYVCDVMFNDKVEFSSANRGGLAAPEEVKFNLNSEIEAGIKKSEADFADVIGKHELAVFQYHGYGKNLIKKFKASPDAFMQMIIQLAYFKMFGENRPTYESAAVRRFQQGRTETCRSVSDEAVAFCKAFTSDSATNAEKVAAARAAFNAHVKYIGDASAGKGVDRHLFGLKKCLKEGEKVPQIFQDKMYGYSCNWFLSTSQLSSDYFNGYGWSQVIDDGFGLAYMINSNSLQVNCVSKKLGSEKMRYFLTEAAEDMKIAFETELAEPKAKL